MAVFVTFTSNVLQLLLEIDIDMSFTIILKQCNNVSIKVVQYGLLTLFVYEVE